MELTKAEEQILHYLWKLEEATVQDILSCIAVPLKSKIVL